MAGNYHGWHHAWLRDQSDQRAMGPAECIVEMPGEITHGLLIPDPFGRGTAAMLNIHATRGSGNDGGTVTLAIATTMVFNTRKPPQRGSVGRLEFPPIGKIFPDSNGAEDVDED